MATEKELRRELDGERRQLTEAVESLRQELADLAERGKKVGAAAAAAAGAYAAVRLVLRLRRR
jgi:uncharacterized protein (UPF0335 family)